MRKPRMGFATTKDGSIRVPVDTAATLERQEVDRVGEQARDRGLTFVPSSAGEYVSGASPASLASSADDSR
jgi:hypothetical protein